MSRKPSHLNIYKALVRARNDVSVMYGDLKMRVLSDSVFAFTRYCPDCRSSWFRRSVMHWFPTEVPRNSIKTAFKASFFIGTVGGGVQLGPLGTTATNRPIVRAPVE
jgi:hypothetical protein